MYRWQLGWIRWSLQLHFTIAGHSAITCLTAECLEKHNPAAHMADRNRRVSCLVGLLPGRNYAAWLTKRCGLSSFQAIAVSSKFQIHSEHRTVETLKTKCVSCLTEWNEQTLRNWQSALVSVASFFMHLVYRGFSSQPPELNVCRTVYSAASSACRQLSKSSSLLFDQCGRSVFLCNI